MRRFVNPRIGPKAFEAPNKTFGVPLEELLQQTPSDGDGIPTAVKKICEHIYKHGVNQEGIFRVSGSAGVVNKLKITFDMTGDADLDEEVDIMAVAGLLKLFLRELPDSLIPEHLTQEFIAIQTGRSNEQDYLLRLRSRLHSLPEENYILLKYILCFLVAVSSHQDLNKMGAMPLSIVFGPNIFRCTGGIAGLKDQTTVNELVFQFIIHYKELFEEDEEAEPVEIWKLRTKKVPPPRPPPPQILTSSPVSPEPVTGRSLRPVPLPRKGQYDSSQYQDGETDDNDKSDITLNGRNSCHNLHSPHFSDEESHGRASPFVLDSESHSIIESPMVTARTTELVEKTICDTITERLFGSDLVSARVSPRRCNSPDDGATNQRLADLASSVRAKVEMFERRTSLPDALGCISHHPGHKVSNGDKPRSLNGDDRRDAVESKSAAGDQRGGLQQDTAGFQTAKKDSGPTRQSSLKFWHVNSEIKEVDAELTDLLEETAVVVTGGSFQRHKWSKAAPEYGSDQDSDETSEDINHNHQSKETKMAFLNILENQENEPLGFGGQLTPECSPASRHKLMVPPLDLSMLHKSVDGSVAVLASSTHSKSWDNNLKVPIEEANGVPSPRISKMKKKNGVVSNTDIPPSPIKHQDQYQKYVMDDEYSHRLKQMTKKIQNLKKKIRSFEEEFDNDHGYKPSQGEKAARPEVKKYMTELSRTRKDLKNLREECERGNRSRHNSGASSSGDGLDYPSVHETLSTIQMGLKEKRQDASRPEDITLMSRDQVQEEKLAVQKALLHFEGLHGRPNTKEDKDLMRPLYDRYRVIKRILAKPMSPRNSLELPTVPEDQMMEIASGNAETFLFRNPIRLPVAEEEEDEGGRLDTVDFAVTRDFTVFRNTMLLAQSGNPDNVHPKVRKKESELDQSLSSESNLHELNMQQLHKELELSRGEKKNLRHDLREFEKCFYEKHGRKVQKEDRAPMQDRYMQYKQIKARLRLLEALVLKHHEGR